MAAHDSVGLCSSVRGLLCCRPAPPAVLVTLSVCEPVESRQHHVVPFRRAVLKAKQLLNKDQTFDQ